MNYTTTELHRPIFLVITEHYIELVMPETMDLRGGTKNEMTKNINGNIFPHLEITELVLFQFNIVYNDYQWDSKSLVYR